MPPIIIKYLRFVVFEIRNSRRRRAGYTLIELLAVTSIIVIVSGLIVGILYSTLRGGNKTRVTNDVAQNGNYALSVISNTALLAKSVIKIGGKEIGVDIPDCGTEQTGQSIEFGNNDGSTVEFSCDDAKSSIASKSGELTTYLIDNNSVKVVYDPVDPSSCSFKCYQSSGNAYSQPIISASFKVTQRSQSTTAENVASSVFSTSVTMRNYNP